MNRILFGFLFLCCYSVEAKIPVRVSVIVTNNSGMANQIQTAIEARFNSTERYVVSSDLVGPLLTLNVMCMFSETTFGVKTWAYKHGLTCHSQVAYFPYKGSSLYLDVEAADVMLTSGPKEYEYQANSCVNYFINETTDEKLQHMKEDLQNRIALVCMNQPVECKPPKTNPAN